MKHNFLRRCGALLLCLTLALSLAVPSLAADGDGEGTGDTPASVSVTLDTDSLNLRRDDAVTLTATVTPADEAESLVWSSSDETVATVEADADGTTATVTAVAGGEAEITAAVEGSTGALAKCKVSVECIYVESIGFSFDELIFRDADEDEKSISVEVYPSEADYKPFDFKSEDTSVITIENETSEAGLDVRRYARIRAAGPGETYITAALVGADDGQPTKNQLRSRVTVSGITLADSSGKRLDEGDTFNMTMGTSQNVVVNTYGDAKNTPKVDWYSDNNNVVSVTNGRLTPRSPGNSKITATRGNYSASFEVSVKENTLGLIVAEDSVPAGMPMSFRDLRSDIYDKFYDDTETDDEGGKTLYYITSLNVEPAQGILYYGYISEADTGSGVSMTDRFFYTGRDTDDYLISGLTFVPRSTFSGNAQISYTAVSSDGTSLSGVIRVAVDAMEDVSYTTGSGQNVFFLGSDFNTVCRAHTGRELASVSFTLPSSSRGTLYYNYTAEGQYSEKVEPNKAYRRSGNPNLDSVSFLPAESFEGSVRISYRGTDTAGGTFSGYVTVTVTDRGVHGDADVRFSARTGREVSFTTSRFNTACREATGETLEYVRFTLPDRDDGTLYYTSGSTERRVSETTAYYRNSSPYISGVSFVPASNAPDKIYIDYAGRSTGGTNYTGTILIDYSGETGSSAIRYSVYSGRAVQFDASDFNSACIEATGSTLSYVRFDLPAASRGLLCYNYSSTASVRSINSSTRYYRSASSGNSLDRVYFLADSAYTGSVSISYTGYSNDGESFNGTVTVQVNSLSPVEVRFSGSGSQPIVLQSSQLRSACNAVMDGDLSYIRFTSLPSSSQGRIYQDYTGYGSGTQVVTGTSYYVTGTPGIDWLSFVPRGGFTGTAVATYTGVSTGGEQVSGQISFTVSSSGTSAYFNDMGGYSWAVPAADFLQQNGVIKGVGNRQYAPGQNIRRCDFVVMMCRAYNFGGATDSGFADVPADSYYAQAVATARNLGIVSGSGNNFHPNDQLTRQDAMVIVKRTLEAAGWSLGGGSSDLSSFGDGYSVADYAQEAVSALVRLGAVKGDGNGNLRPWDPINRAEAAVILHFVMTM